MRTNTSSNSQPKPHKIANSTWAEIRVAHASGLGLRELARTMKIPPGTVLARAKHEGWTQQIREAKALCVETLPPGVPVAVAAARTIADAASGT